MPALNNVQLIGHLGKDPETRFTTTGKKVCHFTLAVNRRNADEPDWFTIEAWDKLGEICQQYLAKGRLAYMAGRLRNERWTDEKGEHTRTKVVLYQMQMLDRRPDEKEVVAEAEEAGE